MPSATSGDSLKDYDGILIPGGFGKRGIEGKIEAIQFARENNIPFLGLCLGFQLATVEYARNKAGIADATSEEFGEGTHVIALLPEQEGVNELGGTMRLGDYTADIREGTLANRLYGQKQIVERHRHRYEVNPAVYRQAREGRAGLLGNEQEPDGVPRTPRPPVLLCHPVPPGVQVTADPPVTALPRVC